MTYTLAQMQDKLRQLLAESLEECVQKRTLHAADLSHIARLKIRRLK